MTTSDDLAPILHLLTTAQRRDLLKAYHRRDAGLLCLRTGRHLAQHGLIERVPYRGIASSPGFTWRITAFGMHLE